MIRFRKVLSIGGIIAWVAICSPAINSCVHQPFALPDSLIQPDPTICFDRDILPIFLSNCAMSGCHDAASRENGYVLDSYENIIKKGIVKGNPAGSRIFQTVTHAKGVEFMPAVGPGLPDVSINMLRRWIMAGATDCTSGCNVTCDTTNFTYSGAIKPLMETYCIGCHYSSPSNFANYEDVKNAAITGDIIPDISHEPGYQPMPQNGAKLLDCQITQVKKWVAAGAPNN